MVTHNDRLNSASLTSAQDRSKMYYDRNTVNERSVFKNGDLVRYRDNLDSKQWKPGQIIRAVDSSSKSHELVNSHGNIIRRNSSLLPSDKTRKSHNA